MDWSHRQLLNAIRDLGELLRESPLLSCSHMLAKAQVLFPSSQGSCPTLSLHHLSRLYTKMTQSMFLDMLIFFFVVSAGGQIAELWMHFYAPLKLQGEFRRHLRSEELSAHPFEVPPAAQWKIFGWVVHLGYVARRTTWSPVLKILAAVLNVLV